MPEVDKVLDNSEIDDSIQTDLPEEGNDPDVESSQSQPELSESEQRAMEQGWRPKEEFNGEPGKWVDADEFLRRGELFEKIDGMGRELRDTKKALRMLQTHHEQVRETEYKRALANLKAQKKQAYEEGDHDTLVEIDDQLSELKARQQAESAAIREQVNQPDPRFVAWIEKNPWYAQDPELRSFSDEVGLSYAKAYPGKDPTEVLTYVEGRVRKAFPDKFTNPNRNRPSAVAAASTPKASKREESFPLTEDERRAMQTFVRQGIMTKEQYVEELKRVKGA